MYCNLIVNFRLSESKVALLALPNVRKECNSEQYSEWFIKKGGNLREDFLLSSRPMAAVCLYVHCLSLIF